MVNTASMPIIDTDTHVTEPPDLWDRFLPAKWKDDPLRPHVEWDDAIGEDRWIVGGHRLTSVAYFALAGWKEFPPSHPKSLEEADPGSWDPKARLQRMDEYGLWAQVLYPNIIAFQTYAFSDKQMPAGLGLDCVRAYNDFLADFASTDARRLVPIMMLPFWDIEASYAELERAAAIGHKGILFAARPELTGLPPVHDPHWDRLFSMAAERGLSLNFHIGFAELTLEEVAQRTSSLGAEHTRQASVSFTSNARAIADVVCTGVCHRHPDLKIVSVESGASWLPYLAEAMDWQWKSFGATKHHPDRELPSFYLKRQVLGTFWFECEVLNRVADLLPDNLMFESDYPHPNGLSPGPASYSETPRATIEKAVAGLPEDLVRKLLYETAAKLYHLDVPATAGA